MQQICVEHLLCDIIRDISMNKANNYPCEATRSWKGGRIQSRETKCYMSTGDKQRKSKYEGQNVTWKVTFELRPKLREDAMPLSRRENG